MSYAMEKGPRPHRITVDEYHRMAEVGLLAPDARVELIDGVIIDMAPIGSPHCRVVDVLSKTLMFAAQDLAIVRTQGAVRLSRWHEPQPDIAILKPRSDEYHDSHPSGRDLLLVVEVSQSSLDYDLSTKSRMYAAYGVEELWVADVGARELHFFRRRNDLEYADVTSTSAPGVIPLPSLPVSVDLSRLFRSE